MEFGPASVTTGAANDIEKATELVRNMVTKWGLSDKLGPITYGEETGEVFLGRAVTSRKEVSEETAAIIDTEVKNIVERNYQRAKTILEENKNQLKTMAEALITYETLDRNQIDDIVAGKKPRPPKGWSTVTKKVKKPIKKAAPSKVSKKTEQTKK